MSTDPQSTFDPSTDARDGHDASPPLPPVPREITARARRRSWHERPVRIWIALTLLVAGTTIYFAIRDISTARRERWLIFEGKKVLANVQSVDESMGRSFPLDQPRRLRLTYITPEGEPIELDVTTPGRERGRIQSGDKIDLRTDPADPQNVTLQTVPRSWIASLAVVCLLAPLAILLAIITYIQRSRVLGVWQNGEPAVGTVVDTHRSGIAPASDIVRFTVDDHEDRRIFTTLYPHAAGTLQAGDEMALVMHKNSPGKAILAELYA
ncbi:MAG: hypothetical protein H7Z14_04265 [Anaerolineae bacterium]|nr:hypothetical protein [Phycisphaerae bacterium]